MDNKSDPQKYFKLELTGIPIKVNRIFIVLFIFWLSQELRNNVIDSFILCLLSFKLQS